jgi:hypothetical protein
MGSGIGSIAKFAIPLAGLGAMTMFPGMALGSGLGASASQALAATGPLGMFGGTGLAGVASPALAASVGGLSPLAAQTMSTGGLLGGIKNMGNNPMMNIGRNLLGGGGGGDQQQQPPRLSPPSPPPIQPLVNDENSFAGAMSRPPRPEIGPSSLPPMQLLTAVPEDRYMGQGTPLPDPLAGGLTEYLQYLQQQQQLPQY